jgi:hypothetical protein
VTGGGGPQRLPGTLVRCTPDGGAVAAVQRPGWSATWLDAAGHRALDSQGRHPSLPNPLVKPA